MGTSGAERRLSTVPVTFSKFSTEKSALSAKKKTSSDPGQTLVQLQKRKEKLQTLSEDKRSSLEEKQKWKNAELRLEGVKIKEDEARLKKTIKRSAKLKAKSAKEWLVTISIHKACEY